MSDTMQQGVPETIVQDPDLIEAEKILNGGDDYTDRKTFEYLLNLMKNTPVASPSAYNFCRAALENFSNQDMIEAGLLEEETKKENPYPQVKKAKRNSVKQEDWDKLKLYLEKRLNETEIEETPVVLDNFLRLSDYLGLKEEEKELIELLYVTESSTGLDEFLGCMATGDKRMMAPLAARALDKPRLFKQYASMLTPDSPLIKYGLFMLEGLSGHGFMPESDYDLWEKLSRPDLSEEEMVSSILGKPTETDLNYDDFNYMGQDLEFIVELIQNAVERGDKGVNILIYGPPGGGKTELSKVLAQHVGLKLYAVGENDDPETTRAPVYDADGDFMAYGTSEKNPGKTSQQRLSQLTRSQTLLKGNKEAFLLFDEMEDLLIKGTDTDKKADTDSKIQTNRLLENNPVVTVWIGNDTDKFHEAVRDRFTHSLYVDYPPTLVRKKMWDKQLTLKNVSLTNEEIMGLARKYDATPRQIAKAVQTADITGKGLEAIEISLPSSSKVSYQSREAVSGGNRISRFFDLSILNGGKEDAAEKIKGLIEKGNAKQPFSLLAKGEKGTGVNSALRYMGEAMTMNVLETSMESLSQPTQFSTPEQNVRSAFNIAADGRQFLIIRDIEALVPDPKSMGANWHESTLVDTFLECALAHKLPFAVTSQQKVELPEHVTRLFSESLNLEPLDTERQRAAYKLYFGSEPSEKLDELKGLLPAEFSNVQKLLRRSNDNDPDTIVDMLKKEQKLRGAQNKPIGF